ncbi:hypothetical protein RHMOL_Rhmol09G0170800 [Rhododendron molle]|uniref:Uncharacterized protein n=1 Tax=Rhododendron molle TaxID=49168 RepID=A0ACC0ME08_RHOML|nr:hypothetical protein RHMOL_Rhmol09G0170800 [Rhododendron molle]
MSTTTASAVKNVLATDVACSKQHLTTCFSDMMLDCFPVAQCGVGMGMVKVLQLENFILNLGNSSSVKLLERG